MKPRLFKTERRANKYLFEIQSMMAGMDSRLTCNYEFYVGVYWDFRYVVFRRNTETGVLDYCA